MNPVRTESRPPLRRTIRFPGTVDVRLLAYEPERTPCVR